MARLERKHSWPTRLFHWLNVPLLGIMIWSGIMIYWANGVYEIKVGDQVLLHFFPKSWYAAVAATPLKLDHRLAEAMAWHFAVMWGLFANGALYVGYTILSGEWRYLVPRRRTFGEAWQVLLHDLKLRKAPLPRRKFNGAQRLAYTSVVAMGLGSILTGLAIYKPIALHWLTTLNGGYEAARLWHFLLMLGFLGFFAVHLAQVIRAGWNNFRAMVIGVEVARDEEPPYAP